jgi:hypothetical protein
MVSNSSAATLDAHTYDERKAHSASGRELDYRFPQEDEAEVESRRIWRKVLSFSKSVKMMLAENRIMKNSDTLYHVYTRNRRDDEDEASTSSTISPLLKGVNNSGS